MTEKPPFLRFRSVRSCFGLLVFVIGGLVLLFALAGRRTPEAWRKQLEEAGEPLVTVDVRTQVPDEENAAVLWKEFEQRWKSGDPVFLKGRNIPRELYVAAFREAESPRRSDRELVDWTLSRSIEALRLGEANDADRALVRAGLDLLAPELAELDALADRSTWYFDDERPTWNPKRGSPDYGPQDSARNLCHVLWLGDRGEQLGWAFDWSTARALVAYEDDDPQALGRWLLVQWHVVEAFRAEPFAPEFCAHLSLQKKVLDTLVRVLDELEPTADTLEFERRLAAHDIYHYMADALRTRRIDLLAWFEEVRGTPTRIDEGFGRWIHWVCFGLDVQTVAGLYNECIAALEGPKHEAPRVFRFHEVRIDEPSSWISPSVRSMFGPLYVFPDVIGHVWEVQRRTQFLRVALTERLHGQEAAIALAESLTDLATGAKLRKRTDPDGTIHYWSVGGNERDDRGALDDMEVVLGRRATGG